MSRSNPSETAPNPAVRWFEWNGEAGMVRYYDKDQKQNVEVGSKFTFILLDQLASVRGWHEASQSGIYSNEVRDTRKDVLVVKAFKEGILAEGLYKDIKDRIGNLGGQFVANCYIAFKDGEDLQIGSIRLKGAALSAWMDFSKAHRADLYKKAIVIDGFTEGKKGRVTFRAPIFRTVGLTEKSNAEAVKLDEELQQWLTGYFSRATREQVPSPSTVYSAGYEPSHDAPDSQEPPPYGDSDQRPALTDDEIPF